MVVQLRLEIINFRVNEDERGCLVAIEENKTIPFEIKRVYYIYNTNDKKRGFHAHRKTKQLMVCLNGSCSILLDDGYSRSEVTLDSPSKGLLIEQMVWHEMYNFSDRCILMVLASEPYDENDYIRNYCDFIYEINNSKNLNS